MFVDMRNIQSLFVDCPNVLINADPTAHLSGWCKTDETDDIFDHHVLYVVQGKDESLNMALPKGTHALCMVDAKEQLADVARRFPPDAHTLVVACDDVAVVCRRLRDYFTAQSSLAMYGDSLMGFMGLKNGLQRAVEQSYRVFNNPVVVIDANFNLIAATWNAINELKVDNAFLRKERLESGDLAIDAQAHRSIMRSEMPVRQFNEELGFDQMLCAIDTKQNLGHIVVSANNRPFSPLDSSLLLTLKRFVSLLMRSALHAENVRGHDYEYFLRNLLDRKIEQSHGNFITERMMQDFPGPLCCAVVDLEKSDFAINVSRIQNLIEVRIPNARTTVFGSNVVAVCKVASSQVVPKEHIEAFERLCEENGLCAGISNPFNDIWDLPDYYEQALRAIELGSGDSTLARASLYKDVTVRHITEAFSRNESRDTFCHPKMRVLLDYDQEHRSEMAYTLYMYIIHERNLAATASDMNMCRSALVYRFKRIHELIGDDFGSPQERMYLALSYEMNAEHKEKTKGNQ